MFRGLETEQGFGRKRGGRGGEVEPPPEQRGRSWNAEHPLRTNTGLADIRCLRQDSGLLFWGPSRSPRASLPKLHCLINSSADPELYFRHKSHSLFSREPIPGSHGRKAAGNCSSGRRTGGGPARAPEDCCGSNGGGQASHLGLASPRRALLPRVDAGERRGPGQEPAWDGDVGIPSHSNAYFR